MSKPIRKVRSGHDEVILVCRKCSRKIDGGFGPDCGERLDKAVRKALKSGKGRKARILFARVGCFDICPKNAVTVLKGSAPDAYHIIPRGTPVEEIVAELGLGDDAD